MIVLCCGDRKWCSLQVIEKIMRYMVPLGSTVVEGEASGADVLCKIVAERRGDSVRPYPAQWGRYGRAAGPIRNQQMLDENTVEKVLAFHDNLASSRGTKDMVNRAVKKGIETWVVTSRGEATRVLRRL